MTYILGFKNLGYNSIISDSRVSWKHGLDTEAYDGNNHALKTGLLFPGCIFGRVGNDQHCRNFIQAFRQSINRVKNIDYWMAFNCFVYDYDFLQTQDAHFQLLLSSRWSGTPRFYLLDSTSNRLFEDTTSPENMFITLGRGKNIFDPWINEQLLPQLKHFLTHLTESRNLPSIFASQIASYFVCLWLSERSLTVERLLCESNLVGGVFHHIFQTNMADGRQGPAVYIYSAKNRTSGEIYSWMYRVAYVQSGLFVEQWRPPNQGKINFKEDHDRKILSDVTYLPDIECQEPSQLIARTEQELENLPFYLFCGFGYNYHKDRGSAHFKLPVFKVSEAGKKSDIITEDGHLSSECQKLIRIGLPETAVSAWTESIKQNPNVADNYLARGLAYAGGGDKQNAITDLKIFLKLCQNTSEQKLVRKMLRKIQRDGV